jgi:hypothetical protein
MCILSQIVIMDLVWLSEQTVTTFINTLKQKKKSREREREEKVDG